MKSEFLSVEKIGGTSMSRFAEILENVILFDPKSVYNRIYVVSAYGGITNDLLEHKKTGDAGIFSLFQKKKNFEPAFESLKHKLFKINEGFESTGLDVKSANKFVDEKIKKAYEYLASMEEVLASGYIPFSEILPAAREMLASIGESHSAFNSSKILKAKGYNSINVDLSGWGDHRELTINDRVEDGLKNIDFSKNVVFVTGYAKGTEGIMREFDRGYSEVTFSKIAVTTKAKEAVIHKEFHLSSADPNLVGKENVKPLGFTNFDVADQLADIGMEAIHPKASKPLESNGIYLRMKNAFDPMHPGTLITKDYICPESKTEVISGAEKAFAIEIHDTRMVGEVGFDMGIMQIFSKHGVSYIGKSTNANSICTIVMNYEDALVEELKSVYELVNIQEIAIICAIGSNIAKPGVLAKAAGALAETDINIISIMQTTRQTNMQFIIDRASFGNAIKSLHKALCE